jgi:hypothetical protein
MDALATIGRGFDIVAQQIVQGISVLGEVIKTPLGSLATKVVETTSLAVAVVGTASAVSVTSVSSLPELLLTPVRLWGLLLTLLGIKKKVLPWGVVYDSVTKQPLDPAYVTLKGKGGREVSSAITDIDGRYGFLAGTGEYVITANKTNYAFPSEKLAGKTADEVYNDLYFGESVAVEKEGQPIAKNIPLDPVKFDWNEFAKKGKGFMKFYSNSDRIIRRLSDPSFWVGFAVSIVTLALVPQPYNVIIFCLYILLLLLKWILKALGLKPKAVGYISDKDGNPLSFALLHILLPGTQTQIAQKVADKYGRYYCLVPKGKYQVKIDRKKPDGSYETVFTSGTIDASRTGMIREGFSI